jgi:hypothetical protein
LIYKRGMRKAHHHDHPGAILDYTSAIQMPDIPSDLKAMALFNRAMVYAASNEESKAISDLRMLIAMRETPSEVRTEAKRKLARMDRRSTASNA